MNKDFRCAVTLFFAGLILIFPLAAAAQDQTEQKTSTLSAAPEKTLEIKVENGSAVSIRSRNASVQEITTELNRYIKVPFALSRAVTNYKPALDLSSLPLEDFLKHLAPFAIVEKRLIGGANAPKIEAVYLYAYNEDIPDMKDGGRLSNVQSYVYEGNTEALNDESADSDGSLIVKYKDEKLSVASKDRLSIAVAAKISEQLGVPLSIRESSTETVNVQFENLGIDQAFRRLPANISLKYWNKLDGSAPVLTELVFGKF